MDVLVPREKIEIASALMESNGYVYEHVRKKVTDTNDRLALLEKLGVKS